MVGGFKLSHAESRVQYGPIDRSINHRGAPRVDLLFAFTYSSPSMATNRTRRAPASRSAPALWRFLRFKSSLKRSRILAHHQAWRSFVPVLVLGALSFIAPNLSTAEIAIVSGSAPRATIVLGKNSGDLDRFAGSELQNYIERLSGVRLRQMSES